MSEPDLSDPEVVRAIVEEATRVTRAEQTKRRQSHARAERLVRWERWRRFLRRHGITVPAFMLPTPKK